MIPPVYNESWDEEVKSLYHHDMREIWDPTIARHIFHAYHNQLDIYQSLVSSEPCRILDVGCAQATLALRLAEAGHEVTALDLRQSFLDYAKSRYERGSIRFLQCNALTECIPGQYDVVFANQVIEHLVYPEEFLIALRSVLVPGGRLVLSTPNFLYFRNGLPSYRQLGDPSKWSDRQFTADGDGHFFAYTALELIEALTAAKFANVQVDYFETPFISGHFKFRHVHSLVPVRWLRAFDRLALTLPWLGRRFAYQLLVTADAPSGAST